MMSTNNLLKIVLRWNHKASIGKKYMIELKSTKGGYWEGGIEREFGNWPRESQEKLESWESQAARKRDTILDTRRIIFSMDLP